MLCMLRDVLGCAGDLGGAKDRFDLIEPFVSVRGWVDPTESTLLVKLGMFKGEAACTFTVFCSTGSGEAALGAFKPK